MPIIDVKRQGVRPAVRKVPTSTCAVAMPMSLDQVGREARSENEEPEMIESLQHAFEKFKPQMKFKGLASSGETEFRADLQFRGIKDFEPSNIMTRQEVRAEDGSVTYLRNDLADLKNNIDLMYRLKDRWKLPAVRRAWSNPEQRKQIIGALAELVGELDKVAEGEK
jgi:predicted component of type VI protein secretion system